VADQIIEKSSIGRVSNLQQIRKASGMTQRMLAEKSGTTLRMIQLYEQRAKDINKAQVGTIVKIARVFGCEITDLLE